MTDKLAAYKLDKAFTEGVDIYLENAPDVAFRVRLPSQYNRAYSQALYGAMDFQLDDNGQVKPGAGLLATRYAQEDAFIQHCLISIDGGAISVEHFAEVYPAALAELLNKASDLAGAIEEKVTRSVKKSSTSSPGNGIGPDARPSTATLKSGVV